jgi:transposase InsO family protein
VSVLCETLSVSRSAYYAWRHNGSSPRAREDNQLKPVIRTIFREHRRRYGARRISQELSARSAVCSRRRVGRLMRQMGLVAIQPLRAAGRR